MITALSTRVLYPNIRADKEPKFMREAVAAACSQPRVRIDDVLIPEDRHTGNEHRIAAVWCLQQRLEEYDRCKSRWWMFRRTGDKSYRPHPLEGTMKDRRLRIEDALRYWKEWR